MSTSSGASWCSAAGGVAAPIAAWLVKHLAARVLGVAAGGLIIVTNAKTIAEALGADEVSTWSIVGALAVLWIGGNVWAVQQERRSRETARVEDSLTTVG